MGEPGFISWRHIGHRESQFISDAATTKTNRDIPALAASTPTIEPHDTDCCGIVML